MHGDDITIHGAIYLPAEDQDHTSMTRIIYTFLHGKLYFRILRASTYQERWNIKVPHNQVALPDPPTSTRSASEYPPTQLEILETSQEGPG